MIKNLGNYQSKEFSATQARIPTVAGGVKDTWLIQSVTDKNPQTLILPWDLIIALHKFLGEVIAKERGVEHLDIT